MIHAAAPLYHVGGLFAQFGCLDLDALDLLVLRVLAHLLVEGEVEQLLVDATDVSGAHHPQSLGVKALCEQVDGYVRGRTHQDLSLLVEDACNG